MPEPNFSGLLDEVRAAYKPHFAEVIRRAARRRHRARAAGALAVTLVALGAAGLATDLGPGGAIPAVPGPSPTLPGPSPTGTGGSIGHAPSIVAGDVNHLYSDYLAHSPCSRDECVYLLAASADRGATWQRRPIPVPRGHELVDVIPIGPATLIAWYAAPPSVANGPLTGYGYLASTDAGTHWHAVTVQDVAAVPSGWHLLYSPGKGYPDSVAVLAASPATGAIVRLTPSPTVYAGQLNESVPTNDGLWIAGNEKLPVSQGSSPPEVVAQADGPPVPLSRGAATVSVSHDGGRTWRHHTFTGSDTGFTNAWPPVVATYDGSTAYTMVAQHGTWVAYRSTDGGANWTPTGGSITVPSDGPNVGALAVRSDGTVVALIEGAGEDNAYASTDQGRTFHPVTEPHPTAEQIPGGYADSALAAGGIWLSPDRVHWTHVPVPAP